MDAPQVSGGITMIIFMTVFSRFCMILKIKSMPLSSLDFRVAHTIIQLLA